MANNSYTGNALSVAQKSTVQVTAYDAATTYTLTVGAVKVSAPGTTDADGTAAALQAAWEASTHPNFSPITATVSTDTVTLTGPLGMPFTVTASVTGGTGTIGAVSEATAATGPHNVNDADNWSDGVPSASDDVFITKPNSKLLWGLDQSAITWDSFITRNNPVIGLPPDRVTMNGDGTETDTTVSEYRETRLKYKAATVRIGEHLQPGPINASRRLRLHHAITTTATIEVFNTGATALESDEPALSLFSDSANTDLIVRQAQGGVGLAHGAGETSTVGDVTVADDTTITSVFIGAGVTLSNYRQAGGDNVLNAAADVTSVQCDGGRLRTEGAWKATAMTLNGGDLTANNAGGSDLVATTFNHNDGSADFTHSGKAQAINTYNYARGSRLQVPALLTITADVRTEARIIETVA